VDEEGECRALKVHVISSCTDRKKVVVTSERRLRHHCGSENASLVTRWKHALMGVTAESRPVREVYAGEHWVEFLRVVESWQGDETVKGWVASAGYGLIPLDSSVVGYAATFSPGSEDSVVRLGMNGVDWWESLSTWEGPNPGSARTVRAIVERGNVGDLVVVTASPHYLGAMAKDLQSALEIAADARAADLLVMGSRVPSDLGRRYPDHVVQFGGGLQRLVGGSRIGLNIRVLAEALKAGKVTREDIRDWVAASSANFPLLPGPDRDRADDGAVSAFIAERLREDARLKATPLLREWRDAGRACEQGRFGRIYRRVVEEMSESGGRGVLRSQAR